MRSLDVANTNCLDQYCCVGPSGPARFSQASYGIFINMGIAVRSLCTLATESVNKCLFIGLLCGLFARVLRIWIPTREGRGSVGIS